MDHMQFSESFDRALAELNKIAEVSPLKLGSELLKLQDAGHEIFTAKVFEMPAGLAVRFGVLHEPSERLLGIIAAFRADRVKFETAGGAVHAPTYNDASVLSSE